MSTELAPEVVADLTNAAPATRQARYQERLASAADALDRGRFADAKRMVQPVLRDLPELAFAHEIAGLALYRDRKSTRLNSSHEWISRMPSSA